jgi:hypothetical protein
MEGRVQFLLFGGFRRQKLTETINPASLLVIRSVNLCIAEVDSLSMRSALLPLRYFMSELKNARLSRGSVNLEE